MKTGDRVALKASFLRSIGDYSYDSASKRGTIVNLLYDDKIASVRWGDGEKGHVHVNNLLLADRLHLEPN